MKTYQHDIACKYDNIIFDLDSTLVTIEGVDELARMKNVEHLIAPMTAKAMNGEINTETAFIQRLDIINPHTSDILALADVYTQHFTEGVGELITWLQNQGKQLFVVSGGYDPSVTHVAEKLGIPADHVFANRLTFDSNGVYSGLKETDYLWKAHGKAKIITEIKEKFPGKTVIIGDGMSDLEAAAVADEFICFAGVVQRQQVIRQSRCFTTSSNLMHIQQFLT